MKGHLHSISKHDEGEGGIGCEVVNKSAFVLN